MRDFIGGFVRCCLNLTSAVQGQTDIFDSSVYKNSSTTLYVANDSFITLLDIYADIISASGRIISNCENCGQLMITSRANASLTCGRTTCKKERLYKANDDYKKRAMSDPIKEAYLNFDNKCRSYRKKLSAYPELLEKYNLAFNEQREKIRAVKRGLTSKSSVKDIERYTQMCFDACEDLRDLAKDLKKLL